MTNRTFFERIKEERKRMGLSQSEFAKLGNVGLRAQQNYENGTRKPDIEYLEALDKALVDTGYILSGQRNCDPSLLGLSSIERAKAVLDMVLTVQQELGLEFTMDNIKTLMGYAHMHCPTKEALKSFVETAYLLSKELPPRNG